MAADLDPFQTDLSTTSSSRTRRYIILILLCFLPFANYYCYSIPVGLQDHIQNDFNVTTTEYSVLYSVYAWPNIFMGLIGGYVIDRWLGVRAGAIVCSVLVFFGNIVLAAGGFYGSFMLLVVGRFIFGLGGDILVTCQNAYSVKWFMGGNDLNFIFALLKAVSRFGTLVSLWINPRLYKAAAEALSTSRKSSSVGNNTTVLGYVVAFGLILCVLSLYGSVQLAWLDRRAHRLARSSSTRSAQEATSPTSKPVKIKNFFSLPLALWLLCFVSIGCYCAQTPFVAQANLFFQTKYDYSSEQANECTAIIYLLAAVTSPFAGMLIDRTGRNLSWLVVASLASIAVFVLLTFTTHISPLVLMCCYGVSFTLFVSAFWPTIAYVVPQNMLATAYGLVQSVLNVGMTLATVITGYIVDVTGGSYAAMLQFLTMIMCVGLLFTLWLIAVDIGKHNQVINMSANRRRLEILEAAKKVQSGAEQVKHLTLAVPENELNVKLLGESKLKVNA